MLTVISNTTDISNAQKALVHQLQTALPQRIACTVGGAGGGFEADVAYDDTLGLWFSRNQLSRPGHQPCHFRCLRPG